jgi:hypothetical protein
MIVTASLRNVAEFGIKTSMLDPELNGFQSELQIQVVTDF